MKQEFVSSSTGAHMKSSTTHGWAFEHIWNNNARPMFMYIVYKYTACVFISSLVWGCSIASNTMFGILKMSLIFITKLFPPHLVLPIYTRFAQSHACETRTSAQQNASDAYTVPVFSCTVSSAREYSVSNYVYIRSAQIPQYLCIILHSAFRCWRRRPSSSTHICTYMCIAFKAKIFCPNSYTHTLTRHILILIGINSVHCLISWIYSLRCDMHIHSTMHSIFGIFRISDYLYFSSGANHIGMIRTAYADNILFFRFVLCIVCLIKVFYRGTLVFHTLTYSIKRYFHWNIHSWRDQQGGHTSIIILTPLNLF